MAGKALYLYQRFKNRDYGKDNNGLDVRNVSGHLCFRVYGSSDFHNKKNIAKWLKR